ncbi:MAG: hypothetical protein ACJ8AO_01890 [Gemmatimonadaceae bacterium]
MSRFVNIAALAGMLALAGPATVHAQGKSPEVPPGYRPPAGMCRIWITGVAPAQQPAPTDCPTAVRNRPSNGKVIFGDDYAPKSKKSKLPPPKKLRGS